jgi:thiamine pyrophosphate-dependent acetolactate synthase large subunit-like protein
MVELEALLPAEHALVTDVGRFKTAPWRHLSCSSGAFTQTGGYGAIGLGLPVAIGSAFARPDLPVVATVGDGGLMMSLAELAVIAEHRLPFLLLVANDGSYGAEWHKLGTYGHAPEHALRTWPSFAALANGFGLDAEVVRTRDDIKRLAPRLSDISAPMVLDIRTDPAVNNRIYK